MRACEDIQSLAAKVVELLAGRSLSMATAESCTGGAISQAITSVPGCSAVMRGAVVAYCNSVKNSVLGVDAEVLETFGAVSEEVVRQMADGVSQCLAADCAIATSGIAGPGGGTPEKPVGTVWLAVKVGGSVVSRKLQLGDEGRLANVQKTVHEALLLLCSRLENEN